MISAHSASYPVRGAAIAAGIDYADALAWVEAPSYLAAREIKSRILLTRPRAAWILFYDLMDDAWEAGRLRVRRWAPNTGGWRR